MPEDKQNGAVGGGQGFGAADGDAVPKKKKRRRKRKKKPGAGMGDAVSNVPEVKVLAADEPSFPDDVQPVREEFLPSSDEVPVAAEEAVTEEESFAENPFGEPEEEVEPEAAIEPELPIEPEAPAPLPPVTPMNPFATPGSMQDVAPVNPFDIQPAQPPASVNVTGIPPEEPVSDLKEDPFGDTNSYYDDEPINPFDAPAEPAPVTSEPEPEPIDEPKEVPEVVEPVVEAKPEVVEASVIESVATPLPEDDGESFWEVLEHAGITKGKIVTILVSLAVVAFVAMFFLFGWYKVFIFWGGDEGTTEQTESVDSGETRTDLSEDAAVRGPIVGIISSYIFGMEYNDPVFVIQASPISSFAVVAGYEAAFVLGQVEDLKQTRYIEYMSLLRQIKSTFETDIYSLVNLSVDRRLAVDNYIELMNKLIVQGDSALVNLDQYLANLNAEYALLQEQKSLYEESFFNDADSLLGESSYLTMQSFLDVSKQVLEVKADYNANSFIYGKLNNYLNAFKPRYQDIIANKEAIIVGIKIYDVPGSDIDAVVELVE